MRDKTIIKDLLINSSNGSVTDISILESDDPTATALLLSFRDKLPSLIVSQFDIQAMAHLLGMVADED